MGTPALADSLNGIGSEISIWRKPAIKFIPIRKERPDRGPRHAANKRARWVYISYTHNTWLVNIGSGFCDRGFWCIFWRMCVSFALAIDLFLGSPRAAAVRNVCVWVCMWMRARRHYQWPPLLSSYVLNGEHVALSLQWGSDLRKCDVQASDLT